MPIQQIRDIVDSIFSSSGYTVKNFNISFPHPLDMKIIRNDNNDIVLNFTQSLPKVTWKKLIKLSAWIQGVTLGQTGGTLRLKYLPDINFSYDDESKELFGMTYDTSDIEQDIYSEYDDEKRQVLAKKCLQYANEWTTIASQGGTVFSDCSPLSRRKLKNNCRDFVIDNIKSDPEIVAGSVILTFLLLYVVLPVVLKFVLERLFKKLFS
jgi:hypothetical protein